MALFLLLFAKAALTSLPTAHFAALRPLFSPGPVCLSFSAKGCTILHALCWSRQHEQVSHFSSPPLRFSLCPCTLSSPPSFFLPEILWKIRQELSSLSCTIRLQWVPGHSFFPKNDAADQLARRAALLVPSAIPCSLSPLISRIHSSLFSYGLM